MESKNIYLAVDYGTSKLLMMAAEKTDDGRLHIDGMENETVKAETITTSCFNTQLRLCANRCTNVVRFDRTFKAYSGQSLRCIPGKLYQVKRQIDGRQVTKEMLEQMEDECLNIVAEQQFDIHPVAVQAVRYYVDEEEITNEPIGRSCNNLRAEYICVIGKSQFIDREEMNDATSVVVNMSVAAINMANKLLSERDRNYGCVFVDFGAHNTSMVVCFGGKIQHVATIPLGGRNVTLDIAKKIGMSEDDAEHNKLQFGCANPDIVGAEHKTISINGKDVEFSLEGLAQIIAARENEILDYIWREIRQLNCFDKITEGFIIAGGASAMKGLDDLIAKRQVKVRRVNMSNLLDDASQKYNSPEYAHIIALLLRADKNCAIMKAPVVVTPTQEPNSLAAQMEAERRQREEEEQRRQEEEERRRREAEEKKSKKTDYIGNLLKDLFSGN